MSTLTAELARELFSKMDLPSSRNENYRFTSVRDVNLTGELRPVAARERMSSEEIESAFSLTAGELAGFFVQRSSSGVTSGEDLATPHSGLVANWDGGLPSVRSKLADDVFAMASFARATSTLKVRVKAGVKLDRPFATVAWFDEATEGFYSTLEITVERGAECIWLDLVGGDSQGRLTQPTSARTVVVQLEEGARVKWVSLRQPSAYVRGFERREVRLARGAALEVLGVASGGEKCQTRTELMLEGEGSEVRSYAVVRAREEQHWDEWVHVHHLGAHTRSELEHRAVIEGKGRSVFNAQVAILPGVKNCEAVQRNPNLLLSDGAQVETFPRLLISNDEVKCAHGATVSSIQPEQLYYLQTRGISRDESERMIVEGFVESVLSRTPTPILRAAFEKLVVGG